MSAPIEVWWIPLDADGAVLERKSKLLDVSEKERAARFVHEHHARRFVCARAGLREILAARTGVLPGDLRFENGPHGKPRLAGPCLFFNLSHSGDLAAAAISESSEVGIDVEEVRESPDVESIAERFFLPGEVTWMRQPGCGVESRRRFFALWTAKEAVMKATGLGFHLSLSGIPLVGSEEGLVHIDRTAAGPEVAPLSLVRLPVPRAGWEGHLAMTRDGTGEVVFRTSAAKPT